MSHCISFIRLNHLQYFCRQIYIALSYAQLANLNPVQGLYAALLPSACYTLLGSSMQVTIMYVLPLSNLYVIFISCNGTIKPSTPIMYLDISYLHLFFSALPSFLIPLRTLSSFYSRLCCRLLPLLSYLLLIFCLLLFSRRLNLFPSLFSISLQWDL